MPHHEDFESGTADGDRCARENRPLPPLRGGAYAVGVLYGTGAANCTATGRRHERRGE